MRKLWASGDPYVWLTGGSLALCLLMVAGLILLIMVNGMGFFWPKDILRYEMADGSARAGHLVERELDAVSTAESDDPTYRIKIKQANRDVYGMDFAW